MKATLIEFGKENKNGRTYLYHEVSDLPKTAPCTLEHMQDAYGHTTLAATINGEQTCAMAKISMDEKGIYAEVTPYENKRELFDTLMMNGATIVPAGTGSLNEKAEVEDYRLHYIFLTRNPS